MDCRHHGSSPLHLLVFLYYATQTPYPMPRSGGNSRGRGGDEEYEYEQLAKTLEMPAQEDLEWWKALGIMMKVKNCRIGKTR
ncbi:hypothetical protein CFP56_040481 [Quercus suber]|uniref:Uncharacterized protein n=1 Tax=Quercus suber TaxID=58331 RepID=A0AAW0IX98_QUESU